MPFQALLSFVQASIQPSQTQGRSTFLAIYSSASVDSIWSDAFCGDSFAVHSESQAPDRAGPMSPKLDSVASLGEAGSSPDNAVSDIQASAHSSATTSRGRYESNNSTAVESQDDCDESGPKNTQKSGEVSPVVHQSTLPPLPDNDETGNGTHWRRLWRICKELLPCVLSVFLGAILIVNKHVAFLSGTADYAFLIIVIYTLFFHPARHTVGKHIQVTGKPYPLMWMGSRPYTAETLPCSYWHHWRCHRNRLVSAWLLLRVFVKPSRRYT